jgi:hypothetical protein
MRWYRELPSLEPASPWCLVMARSVLRHLREALRGAVS